MEEYQVAKKNLNEQEQQVIDEEQGVAQRESRVAARIERLQQQKGWLELADLQETIKESKLSPM